MKITRTCVLDGKQYTMEIPITEEDYKKCMHEYKIKGEHIQTAFRQLSAEHREFILSGITPERWDEIFPEEE